MGNIWTKNPGEFFMEKSLKATIEKLAALIRTNPWPSFAAFLLSLIFVFILNQVEDPENKEGAIVRSADTYIPDGFVLVPIEVQNSESLDSILGSHGVVDLYLAPLNPQQKPKKVASKIKLMRAPLNPSLFAVLAPEAEASKLVTVEQPFIVMIQNPKSNGTRFVKDRPKPSGFRTRKLIYESITESSPNEKDESLGDETHL
jgi:hypothetical protein